MIPRRLVLISLFVATVVTSCSLAPRPYPDVNSRVLSVAHEQVVAPGPWEPEDPDHEGISNIVILASVVALALLFIAWDQGWITPHF